jgi:hypothetical protein
LRHKCSTFQQKEVIIGGDKKLLTPAEAQRIAEKFLLTKYFQYKVKFSSGQLITKEAGQICEMHGKIAMKPRSLVERFLADGSSNTYDFKIEVDAQKGRVINYELT